MNRFAVLPASERSELFAITAERSGLGSAAVIEKDFWVCWTLKRRKFYPRGWARYDLAKPGSFKLVPPERVLHAMRKDYDAMREMIFGRQPSFDEIITGLTMLEDEINALKGAS